MMELEKMTLEELKAYRDQVQEDIADLDEEMPEDETSEEFVDWAEAHEELEDLLDDIVDRIEELS